MKYTVLKGILAACLLLFCIAGQGQTVSNPVGVWDYSIPEAPDEYGVGKAEFKREDGKLTMTLKVGNNPAVPLSVTVKENNVYVCDLKTNEFSMTITLKPDGANLKGTVSSDYWDVGITLTPVKK